MRYISVVAGLILLIAGVAGMTLLKSRPPQSREAVRVNERSISDEECRKAYEERASISPVPLDKQQFIDDLVTREILIQEAKRLGLDREEPFRRSIQSYYEQTLVKNLIRSKMSTIQVSADEREIVSSYEAMGKVYELSVVTLPTEREAKEAIRHFPSGRAEKKNLHADEIPPGMFASVQALRTGEVSAHPVACDKGFLVIRLDGYRREPVPPLETVREEIRKNIEEKKRQAEMERWLEELKKTSRVTINESLAR